MRELRETGRFDLGPLRAKLSEDFRAAAASESDVAGAIRRLKETCGYLVDPHTACAIVAAERVLGEGGAPQVVLSTAHLAKFPDAIEAITGERPALPERLAGLLTAPERFTTIGNDLREAERLVESLARVPCEGRA
jgi:threonine synthase